MLGISFISVTGYTRSTVDPMFAFTAVGGVPFTNGSSIISHTNDVQDGAPFLSFSRTFPMKDI